MPVTLVGNVYYADDPDRLIFRRVWPEVDEGELDDPKWVTLGCNADRTAVMEKVAADSSEASAPMLGAP